MCDRFCHSRMLFLSCVNIPVCAVARPGVYGDVHRVKILFNKKDNALVQMADPQQAQMG